MSRTRFKVVLILLVLILLVASILFGVFTYWLEGELLPGSDAAGARGTDRPSVLRGMSPFSPCGILPAILSTTRPDTRIRRRN
jgi:hypothetical protein